MHVQSSTAWVNSSHPDFLLNRFRELFPFSRGGPAETRNHPVGLSRLLEHLMRLDHGRFWSPKFILYAYSLSARASASRAAFVSSRAASRAQPTMSRAEAYGEYLTPEQLALQTSHDHLIPTVWTYMGSAVNLFRPCSILLVRCPTHLSSQYSAASNPTVCVYGLARHRGFSLLIPMTVVVL